MDGKFVQHGQNLIVTGAVWRTFAENIIFNQKIWRRNSDVRNRNKSSGL
jgi:hypothetical protein